MPASVSNPIARLLVCLVAFVVSLSADKKLTVEVDMSVGTPGQQAGKTTEVWVKQ